MFAGHGGLNSSSRTRLKAATMVQGPGSVMFNRVLHDIRSSEKLIVPRTGNTIVLRSNEIDDFRCTTLSINTSPRSASETVGNVEIEVNEKFSGLGELAGITAIGTI